LANASAFIIFLLMTTHPCIRKRRVALLAGVAALLCAQAQASEPAARGGEASAPGFSRAGSYLAGRHARQLGDVEKSSLFLSHSLGHDPFDERLMKQAVRMHVMAGEMEDAAHIATNLSATHEGTQLSHLVLLAEALKSGRAERAREELEEIPSGGLFGVIRPILASWITLAQTGAAQEIVIEENLRQLMVFDSFLALQNALLFEAAGMHERANAYYAAATEDTSALSYRGLLAAIAALRHAGEEQEAREVFARYVEENQNAQLLDGMTYEDFLRMAGKDKPPFRPFAANAAEGVAEALYTIAGMLYGENAGAETLTHLRLALYLRPEMPDGMYMLGSILEEQGGQQMPRAIEAYNAVIPEHGPVYRQAQMRVAALLGESGTHDAAIAVLKNLEKRWPLALSVRVAMGDVYRRQERFGKAVDAYTAALDLRKDRLEEFHWPILFARGVSYERTGKWERAEQDFQAALKLNPDQPDVLNYLGYSWLTQGTNLDKAKTLLEQAVEERPEDAHIIDSMGWALYLLGDYQGAAGYLEQAVNLMPSDPVVNDHFGDVLWRLGRQNEARFQWERAIQFDPEEDIREKIEKKLHEGLNGSAAPMARGRITASSE
jgi:tetratricopeptide (TPR) repeat protein